MHGMDRIEHLGNRCNYTVGAVISARVYQRRRFVVDRK
jgi:hypothetical protein